VYEYGGRIIRTVTDRAIRDYLRVKDSGIIPWLISKGWLIKTIERDVAEFGLGNDVRAILEHPRLHFISYPYEWVFSALKRSALLHLDLHLAALERGVTLSDASAYNIQFQGPNPVFIDVLSLRPYREGEFWTGHRQFCEQFLNPLLLQSLAGVPYNAWFRGHLEGIPTEYLARVLPWRRKLNWRVFSHVTLLTRMQSNASKKSTEQLHKLRDRKLTRNSYRALLEQLRNWIAGLQPGGASHTVWADYQKTQSYSAEERSKKKQFVMEFVRKVRPKLVWDLGCNIGDYSFTALDAGAGEVIGFDFDHPALETAFARARREDRNFLPIYLDAANPSPDQGWAQKERQGLVQRASADALIALAFEHHLCIGRNIPIPEFLRWLVSLAPTGVVEFIEKSDPTVQIMLAVREDIFSDYSLDSFRASLCRHARIVREEQISDTGRRLLWFER